MVHVSILYKINLVNFLINHGSKNLEKLIDVLERENQLDEKYIKSLPAIKETITQRNIFIIDIKKIL
mgnify:CR=1 FL=1